MICQHIGKTARSALLVLATALSACVAPIPPRPAAQPPQLVTAPTLQATPPPVQSLIQEKSAQQPAPLSPPRYVLTSTLGTFNDYAHETLKECVFRDWKSNRFEAMQTEERIKKNPLQIGYLSEGVTFVLFPFIDRDGDKHPTMPKQGFPHQGKGEILAHLDYIPLRENYPATCAQLLHPPHKIIKVETTNGQMTVVDGLNQAYTAVTKLPELQNGFGCDNLASPPFPWEQIRELYGAYRTSDNALVWLIAYYPPRQFANGTLEQELQQGLREGMLVREAVPGECGLAREVAFKYASSDQDARDCFTFQNLGYPHNIIGTYGYQPKISYEVKNNRVSLKNCFEDELK